MKILVRGANWIGDAVMTIPALAALRRLFPDDEITLQTRPGTADVFLDSDLVDDVIVFNADGSSVGNVLGRAKVLKEKDFDLGILFANSFESALTQRFAAIGQRYGYANEGRSFLLTNAVRVPEWKNERHEVYYYLNLIAEVERSFLGTENALDTVEEPLIPVSSERRAAAREYLTGLGIDPQKPTVALGVGSTNSRAKRWPAESYALLADHIEERLNANVILVGSDGDTATAAAVAVSQVRPIDLTGKTTVAEAAAILAEADVLVSNDMGLAHVAPAVGTSALVIFGPTNSVTTRPFSENAIVIRKTVECSPCMLRDCPIDHRCMTHVTVEEVFDKLRQQMHLHD